MDLCYPDMDPHLHLRDTDQDVDQEQEAKALATTARATTTEAKAMASTARATTTEAKAMASITARASKGHGEYRGQGYDHGNQEPDEWEQNDDEHPQVMSGRVDIRQAALFD